MKNQNERKEWNKRWQLQILEWHLACDTRPDQAELFKALIKLAKSQIRHDPPE